MILYISVLEGLIQRGDVNKITNEDFYYTEVEIPDTMPKDTLMELQEITEEMSLGLEGRRGALKRLGTADIEEKIKEVDAERKEFPDIFLSLTPKDALNNSVNSGMLNGETLQEETNKEMTGVNKTTSVTKI